MKKLMIILLVVASFKVAAQNQVFYVIQWDDTVTVRNVENIRPDMIKNYNYRPITLPTCLDSNVELFLFQGVKQMPLSDQRYYDFTMQTYFLDSFNIDLGWDSTRLCGIQWIETPTDTTNLFSAIDAIEAEYNNNLLELKDQIKALAFYCYFNDAQRNTLTIPTKLENRVPRYRTVITKIWMNDKNNKAIKQAIRDEENTDIDAGWVSE